MLKNIHFMVIALGVCLGFVTAASTAATPAKPNILWIVAENIGSDLGCYGYPLVRTPHLDRFAEQGMRYRLAFSTAPGCSPSRSALMTGMYQTTIGAHGHRTHRSPGLDDHFHLPEGVRPFTHHLADAGYQTVNLEWIDDKRVGTGKTDVNFEVEGKVLRPEDPALLSAKGESVAHNHRNSVRLFHANRWSHLKQHQPFYAQVNFPVVDHGKKGWIASQENPWYGQTHPKKIDPEQVKLPSYYPDHPVARKEWAGYLDGVCDVDERAGAVLRRLEEDGLADNTIVIFFADNGRLDLRGHHWCHDCGDRVPLIIRWPKNFPAPPEYRAGGVNERLVSLVDVTATTLALAGVPKPKGMQGQVFLGKQADPPRTFIVSAADRCDGIPKRCRAIRTSRYRYIRNYTPEWTPIQSLAPYKASLYPIYRLMFELHKEGKLTPEQQLLMVARMPEEELYDLENDPDEVRTLTTSPDKEHRRTLLDLRATLERWVLETDDQGRFPEDPRVIRWWQMQQRDMFSLPTWFGRDR